MATVIPSGKPIWFEYSAYDGVSTLSLAMKVYDLTTTPATLLATLAFTNIYGGTYAISYVFPASYSGKNLLLIKSVYTDGTFATLNTLYSPGSECVEIDGFDNNFGRAT